MNSLYTNSGHDSSGLDIRSYTRQIIEIESEILK